MRASYSPYGWKGRYFCQYRIFYSMEVVSQPCIKRSVFAEIPTFSTVRAVTRADFNVFLSELFCCKIVTLAHIFSRKSFCWATDGRVTGLRVSKNLDFRVLLKLLKSRFLQTVWAVTRPSVAQKNRFFAEKCALRSQFCNKKAPIKKY